MDNINADHGNDHEKLFTQEEVNEILKKRLERYKEKHEAASDEQTVKISAELDARSAELDKKELKLDCKAYLSEMGYDANMLDIIQADDFDTFKDKADRLNQLVVDSQPKREAPPLGNPEMPTGDDRKSKIADAFSIDNRHKPKDIY